MPFEIEVKAGGERIPVEELARPGIHTARIESIGEFNGTKFGTQIPMLKARLVFTVVGGKHAGKKAEAILTPSLDEKATLYPIFVAATGKRPVPGQRFDINKEMIGKVVQIVVERRPDSDYTKVASVVALEADDEDNEHDEDENDDLAGA
ncbi:MAG TPA: hypothetical protein VNM48_11650 [Chloroflexota bacterium]|nr:hypothetical protein [Chloroflexota bacterium]